MRPPAHPVASSTVTDCTPLCIRRAAADSPAIPAPMITTRGVGTGDMAMSGWSPIGLTPHKLWRFICGR